MTENNAAETSLSDFERKRLVEQIYIAFPRLNRVYSLVEHCHQHSKIAAEPECLLVTGRQGAGKTTLRRTYSRRYPRRATREGISVPVLDAAIPVPATVKHLVTELCAGHRHGLHQWGISRERGSPIGCGVKTLRGFN
jgi:Bacterial TniB protein